MAEISFKSNVEVISGQYIVRVPLLASKKLPSRGMTMVNGTINDVAITAPLEPDGNGSHWLLLDTAMQKKLHAADGDTVTLAIEPTKNWPEPKVPDDVQKALKHDDRANAVWQDITPMARWDWLRWIRGTKNSATRQRRIEVMCSKLNNAKRRPCCFNRSSCTDPFVSNNGVLIASAQKNG